jgi:hypothetical protein
MKKVIFLMAFFLIGTSVFAQNTNELLNNYISIKNALVESDSKAASQVISTFYQLVNSEDNLSRKAELLKATEKLHKAADNIDKERAAFNDVSTSMWDLVKDAEYVNQPVYYQYCPMKKGYWLSKEKEIENPYYGSAMLSCGKIVETKE